MSTAEPKQVTIAIAREELEALDICIDIADPGPSTEAEPQEVTLARNTVARLRNAFIEGNTQS